MGKEAVKKENIICEIRKRHLLYKEELPVLGINAVQRRR
jgi:hypothetical protein